ncbi:MAG: hypothetical protein E6J87_25880 [Deltaproteobacteria bacterium]|nr:MAG: hypothetical protein E6J87_25880 [Deltaproteobacteria bacterium]
MVAHAGEIALERLRIPEYAGVDPLHDEALGVAACAVAARDDRVVDVSAFQHVGRLERVRREQREQDVAQRGEIGAGFAHRLTGSAAIS